MPVQRRGMFSIPVRVVVHGSGGERVPVPTVCLGQHVCCVSGHDCSLCEWNSTVFNKFYILPSNYTKFWQVDDAYNSK